MRRLTLLAVASLGLGLTAFQPASFADCRDADCLKACNEWEQKAVKWRDKYNRYTSIKATNTIYRKGTHVLGGICWRFCNDRVDHPQDKYTEPEKRKKAKRTCDQYKANKDKNERCRRSCDNPTKKYNQMSDKEQKQWVACITGCDKKFPLPRMTGREECGMSRY